MANNDRRWNDEKIERIIGELLRVGVLTAAGIVLLGGVFYLLKSAGAHPDYSVFKSEEAPLRNLAGTVREAFSLQRLGIIQLGILVLIATPVFRVAFSVLAFLAERDRFYVGVTLLVLAILLFSLLGDHI